MKRRDLEKKLAELGWTKARSGGNHDVWTNGESSNAVPRHREINEITAKKIIQKAMNNPGVKK